MIKAILSQQKDLSSEVQRMLAVQYKNATGQEKIAIANQLVGANYKLIFSIMKKLNLTTEYYSAGIVGFLSGIESYDPNKNNNFTNYICLWVKAKFLEDIRSSSNGAKFNDVFMRKLYYNYNDVVAKMKGCNQEISEENLCNNLGVDKDTLQDFLRIYKPTLSLDYKYDNDDEGESTLYDKVTANTLTPEQIYSKRELKNILRYCQSKLLTAQEKQLLELLLTDDVEFKENQIAKYMDITPQRVNAIKKTMIAKMQKHLKVNAVSE